MTIRQWFGSIKTYKPLSKEDHKFDTLLELYKDSIHTLFGFSDASNIEETLNSAMLLSDLSLKQKRFLSWLDEKGIPTLRKIVTKNLVSNQELLDGIEYEIYLLKDELESEDKEDLISYLINIVVDMPDRIGEAEEEQPLLAANKFVKGFYYELDMEWCGHSLLTLDDSRTKFYLEDCLKVKKVMEYTEPKIIESANLQTLLFIS